MEKRSAKVQVAGSRGKLPDQVSSGREAGTGNEAEKGVHDSPEKRADGGLADAFAADRSLCRISFFALLLHGPDDGDSGTYRCPTCAMSSLDVRSASFSSSALLQRFDLVP